MDVAGGLYVCSGKEGLMSTYWEKLIIKDNKLMFVAEMNGYRPSFQIVSCWKYFWAICGYGGIGILNACEYYDEIIDKFTNSSNMLQKRLGHSGVAFRAITFVIGGLGTLCS